jgi:energy-coupling factor transporter ATP-binding protein EcfA2
MYGDAYIRRIRNETKLRQLFKSQGWKSDDTEFVLADKLYRKGEVVQAGYSHGMHEFLAPFHSRGSLEPWRILTEVFDHPGFEPHAFMLLLAFAAPLLKLAGREGCTINALGESGVGKSTMAQFMSSVYGSPKGAWVGRKDTELARMQRLGAHFNLPVYMDEATTIDNKQLRDLIYSIPTGKNRSSMKSDYTLRPGAEWVTLFVTSTNNSLQSKLQLENQNAEAETLRLFEFKFPRVPEFAEIAKIVPSVIQNNYGVAGPVYIQYLVQNREAIKEQLQEVVGAAERAFEMGDKERFWSQVTALALYGGELACAAGVINFDPSRIRGWLLNETRRMRGALDESLLGPIAVLSNFLNEHVGERLVVTGLNAGMSGTAERAPYHEISQRYETDSKTLWINRKRVKYYMDKHHFGFSDIEDGLVQLGVLVDPKTNKSLGAGTNYSSGPSPCWKLNMAHSEVAGLV